MKKRYDVIVVGGGPAGCSAASFLARDGYEVLLVDKAEFPRDKVCGDAISPLTLSVLERIGLRERIQNMNPWRIHGLALSSPEGKVVRTSLSDGEETAGHGYVLPRKDFDLALFQHVQALANVHVLEGCVVTDLVRQGDVACGIRVQHENSRNEFRGDVLVGADGAHSVIAKKTLRSNTNARRMVFAARAYFSGVKGLDHDVEIHCDESILPGYLWVFPTGEGTANVGIGGSYRSIARKNIQKLFDLFTQNGFLKERLNKAEILKDSFRAWPLPLGSCFSRRSRKNVLLVGDAGGFADPLTGEGIYYALRGGECAAKAIDIGFRGDTNPSRVGDIYEKQWRKAFKCKEYLLGYLVQSVLRNKHFLNFNVRRACKNPAMARTLAAILCHEKSKIRLLL
jgi:geranylgeranyl reductase family protein